MRAASGEEQREALERVPGVLRSVFRQNRPTPGRQPAPPRSHGSSDRPASAPDRAPPLLGCREYPADANGQAFRPDRSQLHLAPGRPMPRMGNLHEYLLMKWLPK